MKLLFKQRMFSWFDSYDIYYENGEAAYTVKGQLSWGHCLKIFDARGTEVSTRSCTVPTSVPRASKIFRQCSQDSWPFTV